MTMLNVRLALVAACIAVPAGATTLVDGGFEAKGAALPVNSYCYDTIAAGDGVCAAGAWTGDAGVIRSGSVAWGSVAAASGNYYGFVQTTHTVQQDFAATETGTGTVNWVDTNRASYGGLQSYDVWIDHGMASQQIGSFSTAVGGWVSRTSSSFALVNGQSYTLRFTGLANVDSTAFIDDVSLSVTPSTVPEPASWAMLLTGFGLVGTAIRRRRVAIIA
jgi:hypothetical protein